MSAARENEWQRRQGPRPRRAGMRAKSQTCKRCGEKKLAAEFSLDRSRDGSLFPWCKACVAGYIRERRGLKVVGTADGRECPVCLSPLGGAHRNRVYCSSPCKEKARRYRTFGLTPGEYRRLIDAQHGKCPICDKRVKVWALDHNHTTGETLGATCIICNHSLIAYAYHDIEIARRLVAFLEAPPVRTMFGERRYVGPEALSQLHRMWAWNGEEATA